MTSTILLTSMCFARLLMTVVSRHPSMTGEVAM